MNNNFRTPMIIPARTLAALGLGLVLFPAFAQFGPPGGGMGGGLRGPSFSGSTAKLFGDNSAFSATMEMRAKDSSSGDFITMPGRISVNEGKSRFEMDITQARGGNMKPEMTSQMKAMGMDKMVMISRPDKKLTYLIYPGLQAYAESAMPETESGAAAGSFKVETTELGKETVEGHPCVKSKAVVTDEQGKKHEATVWNATDLKNFPVKIEQTERGTPMTMLFKDIKLAKPEDAIFAPPADYKRYDSVMALMQAEMMKRMGGAGVPPPGR